VTLGITLRDFLVDYLRVGLSIPQGAMGCHGLKLNQLAKVEIRARAHPDRATKRILFRGVARDDDHRLSPCMISDVGLRRPVVEGAGPKARWACRC
jgi:hypothetical protein